MYSLHRLITSKRKTFKDPLNTLNDREADETWEKGWGWGKMGVGWRERRLTEPLPGQNVNGYLSEKTRFSAHIFDHLRHRLAGV